MGIRQPRLAVSAMFALNGGLLGIWASRIPAFAERFDLSERSLGLLLLCLAGGAIIAFPIAGHFSDTKGAALTTKRIAVLYAIALCLLPFAPSPALLAGALALFGAAHGAFDVTMNGWAAEVERHMGKPIMSSFHALFSLGAGLGAASGILAGFAALTPQSHFLTAVALFAPVALFLANVPWTVATRPRSGALFALPKGVLILVGLAAFSAAIGEGAMTDWSAVYMRKALSTGEGIAALGFAVFSIAMVGMRLIGDHVVARLGPIKTARICGVIALIGVILLTTAQQPPQALLGFAFLGLGYAIIFPLAYSRAANDPEVASGQALAAVATLGYGGALLGPVVIGLISHTFGLRVGMGVLGLFAIAITLLAHHLRAPKA